jgi:tetratricopeptide (TPR) repeat protein
MPLGVLAMKNSSLLRLVLVLAMCALFFAACSRDPNVRKQKYFESGQRYFAEAKYREAAIQFRNALQVDNTFAAAHYQLGQTYLKLQDGQYAYIEIGRTLELDPDNYKAHADMANLLTADYAATSNPADLTNAKQHTDLLLEKRPNDPETHLALANLLNVEKQDDQAIAEVQKAIALAPNRGDSYLSLALMQTRARQFDSAEASYKKAIELNATAANPHIALAAFYVGRNRYPEAEQQVQTAISADPKDLDARTAMARLYIAQGKKDQAEAFLQQVKRDFPKNSKGYRMLGDYYFAEGDYDKALAEYASLHDDHPKDAQVTKNYVQLLILKNRLDDADKVNEALLKSSKLKDEEALVFRGEIQLHRNKVSDAVQTFQSVVTTDPDMAMAHYQLGLALSDMGQLDRAAGEWQQAIRLQPGMTDADRALAQLALRNNDMTGLERYAGEIIRLQPASADGYVLRSISLMAHGRFPAAEADAQRAIAIAPTAAAGYVAMGNMNFMQQKYSAAESWYEQALTHDPNSIDGLSGLSKIYLAQKQPDHAIARIRTQIAASPNNDAFYDLLGSVLFSKKDFPGAESALNQAVQLNKNNVDAYVKLGQTQTALGELDKALATYSAGAAANPNQAVFYIVSGGVYEKKHDLGNAKSAYETALQLQPNDPGASNNLAYVLLETNDSIDKALQLAQNARRGLPESPDVADTLGWALYQKGVYASAISMFQEAIKLGAKSKIAENPTYHYHLGLAYAKADKPALARQHLEHVLKLDPNYSGAADIKKELAQLKS